LGVYSVARAISALSLANSSFFNAEAAMAVALSKFSTTVTAETAFDVLATAKRLKAAGKDVVELEIGDSPFPSAAAAEKAGIEAIQKGACRYGPSIGLPEFRQAAAEYVNREYGLNVTAENVVAGPGAKTFELFFCETYVDPGDGVLVFSPHFPTYPPNILRRAGRITYSNLTQEKSFRPNLDDVRRFLADDPSPKAIFLNSPHNPTGGVATEDDLKQLADLIRGKNVAVFSDEPYDQMAWSEKHHSLLAQPGMIDHCVAAYTFSKTFSMSGWRLGFAVSNPQAIDRFAMLTNSSLSCVPPFSQLAGIAAMRDGLAERDERMAEFRRKVELLVAGLNKIEGFKSLMPGGTFYVFPSAAAICNRLNITSHGLALYLLEAADDQFGVACLGGECFGAAGRGFLRFSCAEPDDRLQQALDFLPTAISRTDRVEKFLTERPKYRLTEKYAE
jgi:aspartate aminotransferase